MSILLCTITTRDVPIPKFEPIPVPILNFKAKPIPIFGFFNSCVSYKLQIHK